ncbi:MAG: aminotransferase class I/II-fold pyridoxal phosphate-dependent enzyme [Actinomycetota bacterium]|nr:aminotransferase class I/II-fold pyridoxal phosphate-dependent enzyme [Actinomycetota bacterium]MDQ2958255.1 aminotransferase class I/II-fold pyridoxal phosphate-dependent enzyme [Actinomycetota bacterium]
MSAPELSPTAVRDRAEGVVVLSTGDVRLPLYLPATAAPRYADQRYRAAQGEPDLRAAIADWSLAGLDPAQVLVTPGARQALLLAFATLPAERREILLPSPYWASYPKLAGAVGAELTVLDRLDLDALRAAAGPRTGAVLVNSPRNPDGSVIGAEQLAELVDWTRAADLLLIFDQVYRGVPLPGPLAPSPLDLPGGLPEHCLVIDGLTKSHALAGLRIGWLIAAPALLNPMSGLASHLIGGTCSAAQDAALDALRQPGDARSELGRQLAANRDYGVARLDQLAGVRCPSPAGGIFLFPDLAGWLASANVPRSELVGWLEQAHAVAVVDGAAFGAPGHLRLSFAVDAAQFQLGVDRLVGALREPGR